MIFTRDFSNLAGKPAGHKVARLNADGTQDTTSSPALGTFPSSSVLTCMGVHPDSKIMLGGCVLEEDGFGNFYRRSLLIRLNANGSTDNTFTNGNGTFGGAISSLGLQADGKILIADEIVTSVNGMNHYHFARLNANRTVDTNFNSGVDGVIHFLDLQSDGKILLAGYSTGSGTNCGVAKRRYHFACATGSDYF